MAIGAGAPRTPEVAKELARRCGVGLPADASLTEVTATAEANLGAQAVQEHLAEMVTGWRLRPTPALTALAGTPQGRVYTSNYDDGIERSARWRGLEPVSLLPVEVETVQAPSENQVQVVHLHGLPDRPESLVLPGRGMDELASSEVFQRFVSSRMAASNLLYLGFSFASAEHHLTGILKWIAQNVSGREQHYLLLSETEMLARAGEMDAFRALGFVNLVGYAPDPAHTTVERVALALAPRTADAVAETRGPRETPTTVQPILVEAAPGDDQERLAQKVLGFDHGWSGGEDITTVEQMLEGKLSLLLGGPGMGKTTLLESLPLLAEGPSARGKLRSFAPGREDAPPEESIAHLLEDGELRLAREDLDAGELTLGLDGFDEIEEHLRAGAAAAILAAVERWPQHRWLVMSRPCGELQSFGENGFSEFQIVPSRRWARRYLEVRSVPAGRIKDAMLDGYGLGDLLGIPVFAARLADRLLDEADKIPSPLQLLVEEQYAASAREARKAGKNQADLGEWMRSLAVALELSGRSSAPASELAQVTGPDGLGGEEARERLVAEALLADTPGVVAFPLKTLQEGLCADAILKAPDPAAALRNLACAEVAGVQRLREDMELTVDLVFEHAEPSVRAELRALDEARWARTVVTGGSEEDAREALEILHGEHVRRGIAYGIVGEGALRTSWQAVTAIGARWPAIIEERRAELEADSRAANATVRLRALQTLGALPEDDDTEGWLLPRLADESPQVSERAAAVAGRLGIAAAEPALRALLESKEGRLRTRALAALVEIVDLDGLVEVGAQAASTSSLQPILERLLERLDLDHGIELVAGAGLAPDGALPALLGVLIADVPREAWTRRRVTALMRACANLGPGGPEPQALGEIFAGHPEEAIAAVCLQQIGGGPWGPATQLTALSYLDPALLAGEDRAELRSAVERAVAETGEREERQHRHEREMARFLAALDEHGAELEPEECPIPAGALHNLTGARRDAVAGLVGRWWPASGLAPAPAEADLEERTRAMLTVGASSRAAISDEHWLQLLDAHLAARSFREPELAEDKVVAWLADTYEPRYQHAVLERLRYAGDALDVSKLFAIAGRSKATGALTDAAIARLEQLGHDTAGWSNVVGLLAEAGASNGLRRLLTQETRPQARRTVITSLAQYGDAQAQLEALEQYREAVTAGEQVERPHWRSVADTPELVGYAAELASAALAAGEQDLAGFALAQLQAQQSEEALAALSEIVQANHEQRPWMSASVEQVARKIATLRVLKRLPEGLADIAADFARLAAPV